MLHRIHVQPLAADAVQPLDPGRHLLEVFHLGRDHQHGVQLAERHKAEQAGDGRSGAFAQQLIQLAGHGLAIHVAQPKHADGHALEPIHVEGVNRTLDRGQLLRAASHDQQIAGDIGPEHAALGHQRRDDRLHLDGANIIQGDDSHAVSRPTADSRSHATPPNGAGHGHNPVQTTFAHQHRLIHPQQRFQGGQQLLAR